MKKEKENTESTGIPIADVLFRLLDILFKDANGKILATRVATLIIIFIMSIIWVKGDSVLKYYKESSYESYETLIEEEREKEFKLAIKEQLKIVHTASGADFSVVYVFRPKNANYFVDVETYEGTIPYSIDPKNMGGFPIDKTSTEYMEHIAGREFMTSTEFVFLPTNDENKGVSYMYSCPYYNMDNVYSGAISMYWIDDLPSVPSQRLETICAQAARVIGRAR